MLATSCAVVYSHLGGHECTAPREENVPVWEYEIKTESGAHVEGRAVFILTRTRRTHLCNTQSVLVWAYYHTRTVR